MEDHKKNAKGLFDKIPPVHQNFILECMACAYYRNGLLHPDGSRGEVKISPGELRDFLAYAMIYTAACFNEGGIHDCKVQATDQDGNIASISDNGSLGV